MGQISSTTSDINNIDKQIQKSYREQHTDEEIIRGVNRIDRIMNPHSNSWMNDRTETKHYIYPEIEKFIYEI